MTHHRKKKRKKRKKKRKELLMTHIDHTESVGLKCAKYDDVASVIFASTDTDTTDQEYPSFKILDIL